MGGLSYEAVGDDVYVVSDRGAGGPFKRSLFEWASRPVTDLRVADSIPANCHRCGVMAWVEGVGHMTEQRELSRRPGGVLRLVRVQSNACGDAYAFECGEDTIWLGEN